MKVYVCVDMEGISGVVRAAQCTPGSDEYARGQRFLTDDVNACIEGCFDGGATTVTIRDLHGNGNNILWEDLDPRVKLIQQGWIVQNRMPELEKHDAVMLLGYHPMAGTRHGLLEHTQSSGHWQRFWINGRESGEIATDMGIAGDHELPVILVSGSEKACAEARKFVRNVVVAPVKKDLDVEGAVLLSRQAAHTLLHRRCAEAVHNARSIKPYKVRKPVKMRLERVSRSRVPEGRAGVKVIDGRTYEVVGPDVESALWML